MAKAKIEPARRVPYWDPDPHMVQREAEDLYSKAHTLNEITTILDRVYDAGRDQGEIDAKEADNSERRRVRAAKRGDKPVEGAAE